MRSHATRHSRGRSRPPGRGIPPSLAVTAILLAWWCAVLAAPEFGTRASADERRGGAGGNRDGRLTWHRRWWLDVYTHTMQEECFIAWMDVRYRHVDWKLGLPVRQVESIYRWWVPKVWDPSRKGDDKGG